jgi:signal transduction histidine kinase
MFGRSKDEAIGQVPSFLGDSQLIETAVSAVARDGRWSGEVPLRRTDGRPRVADLVLVPLKDAAGEILGTVGVLRDVTERKRSEREVSRTLEMLRESDRERRQLVSRLVAAREEEATRIAGEIHDDPIQKLRRGWRSASACSARRSTKSGETTRSSRSRRASTRR